MEHCYTTYATGKIDFETTLAQIKALGADKVVLGTDLGQKNALYPDEGLLDFANRLYENGFSEKEIRKMTVDNNRNLLSL
jgi:microsomal dipeptidase-like Zn-dependent dipeptidase